MKNWITENKYFLGSALACFIYLLAMSLQAGINQDDRFHVPQGIYTMKWYTSFGKDKSFMIPEEEGGGMVGNSTYDYGVLLEIVNNVVNNTLGFEPQEERYHTARHLIIAMFGFIGVFFAGMVGRYMFGWQAGVMIMLLLLFTPRFFGHATFNPKDLPFAVGYMAALYFMIRFIDEIKNPRLITAIGLAGSLAIALSARIGGLLLIIYAFMFTGIAILLNGYFAKKQEAKKSKKAASTPMIGGAEIKAIRNLFIISLAGYFGGLLFWPYGLMDPINNPLSVLQGWTQFRTTISILFDGAIIQSNDVPWNYIPKYIVYTTPIIILVGYLVSLWMIVDMARQRKTNKFIALILLHFTIAFPIFYVIYKDSVLYDGFRHMLFTLAPIVTLGGLGLYYIYDKIPMKPVQDRCAGIDCRGNDQACGPYFQQSHRSLCLFQPAYRRK